MAFRHLHRSVVICLLCAKCVYTIQLTLDDKYPFKYYCHFDELLQSVCLAKHQNHGISFISSNTVSTDPRGESDVSYKTNTCPSTRRSVTDEYSVPVWSSGKWKDINTQCLPWTVTPPVRYSKVSAKRGHPGYLDIHFTQNDTSKKFTHLIPVSSQEVPLPSNGNVTFVINKPIKWTATLTQGKYSEKTKRHDRILTIARKLGPISFTFIKTRDFGRSSHVEQFSASGLVGAVEVFFFKLPTNTTQYAIMLTTFYGSYMLYRTDEVHARGHDILPPPDEEYPGDPPPYEVAITGDFHGDVWQPYAIPSYDESLGTVDGEASGGSSH